jgi:peptidoglycan hydrolase-like protein with peptidoglycan-binding domain
MHLSRVGVTKGAKITGGDYIGHAGSTGGARATRPNAKPMIPHLHFQTKVLEGGKWQKVPPNNFINRIGNVLNQWTGNSRLPPVISTTTTQPVALQTLRKGMRGEEVRRLQAHLGIAADGIFGSQTATALRNYQQRTGLKVDGIFGPQTRAHLFGAASSMPRIVQPQTSSLLRRGMRGEEVRRLQTHLGIAADGIFGPQTATALRNYQQRTGLKVDGIFGPQTRAHLYDPLQQAMRQLR